METAGEGLRVIDSQGLVAQGLWGGILAYQQSHHQRTSRN